MQEISDYVAVFIAPVPGGLGLVVKNVGRVNVYLHKWEIGALSESFITASLLPIDPTSSFGIGVPPNFIGQHLVKLYLTDEGGKKYVSTGQMTIQATSVGVQVPYSQPSGIVPTTETPGTATLPGMPAIQMAINVRAQSFKTVPYDWMI